MIIIIILFVVCLVEGNNICLPIQKCSGGTALPTFLINGEEYFPRIEDIINNEICFRNVTNHMHYIEVCHEACPFCSSPRYDQEFIISKRVQIEVTTGKFILIYINLILSDVFNSIDTCSTCYNQCGLEASSTFARQNHCGKLLLNW